MISLLPCCIDCQVTFCYLRYATSRRAGTHKSRRRHRRSLRLGRHVLIESGTRGPQQVAQALSCVVATTERLLHSWLTLQPFSLLSIHPPRQRQHCTAATTSPNTLHPSLTILTYVIENQPGSRPIIASSKTKPFFSSSSSSTPFPAINTRATAPYRTFLNHPLACG